MFVSLFALFFYLFLISTGQYPVVFDKTDHSDPTMYCDEFDLKKISNMTETPKIIIIGKIIILNHLLILKFHVGRLFSGYLKLGLLGGMDDL